MCELSLQAEFLCKHLQSNAPHLEFSIPFNIFPISTRFFLWIWLDSISATLFLLLELTGCLGNGLENALRSLPLPSKRAFRALFLLLLAVSLW